MNRAANVSSSASRGPRVPGRPISVPRQAVSDSSAPGRRTARTKACSIRCATVYGGLPGAGAPPWADAHPERESEAVTIPRGRPAWRGRVCQCYTALYAAPGSRDRIAAPKMSWSRHPIHLDTGRATEHELPALRQELTILFDPRQTSNCYNPSDASPRAVPFDAPRRSVPRARYRSHRPVPSRRVQARAVRSKVAPTEPMSTAGPSRSRQVASLGR